MPNLTPTKYRALYEIYPAKACIRETAEACQALPAAEDSFHRAESRDRPGRFGEAESGPGDHGHVKV